MQLPVHLLWSLLEACRAGSEHEQRQAADACATELAVAERASAGLHVERIDAQLVVDGCAAASGADAFAANHGLLAFLREAGVTGVWLAHLTEASALLVWARQVVRAALPDPGKGGASTVDRGAAGGIVTRTQRSSGPADLLPQESVVHSRSPEPESRLRSLYLQHRLLGGLPEMAGVDPATQKLVIQAVVDRLLQLPSGLEPLMLLQQDDALLQRSTAVAVLTVLFARRSGWPDDQLADLGAAGLLHDLGTVLDAENPSLSAFHWLLSRGDEDFWLRSALVARRFGQRTRATEDPAGPLAAVALVRLAAAAHESGDHGLSSLLHEGAATEELCQLARDALAMA